MWVHRREKLLVADKEQLIADYVARMHQDNEADEVEDEVDVPLEADDLSDLAGTPPLRLCMRQFPCVCFHCLYLGSWTP